MGSAAAPAAHAAARDGSGAPTTPGSVPAESGAASPPLCGVPAAVLVGLLAHPDGPRVVLTQRTPHLRVHADQISFPGGRVEESDDSPAAAALREAFEEIGLLPGRVELLGCLPLHRTVTDFLVHPFVGWIEPPVEFVPDPHEVAHIIQVPLDFVLDATNHRRETLRLGEVTHTFYVLYYAGHRIWGATAGILVSLARVLGSPGGTPSDPPAQGSSADNPAAAAEPA